MKKPISILTFLKLIFAILFFCKQAQSIGRTSLDSVRLEGDSKITVGAYYFGVFNPSFRFAYRNYIQYWPIDVQQRPQIWWYGVEDLYLRQGQAFQELFRMDPTYDTSYLKPVIGYHNNSNVEVLEKHIDQAADGGLDYFNFYWYWSKSLNSQVMQESIDAFKRARNKSKLKFQITLFFHPWDPDHNLTANDSARALDQIIEHVRDPQYLKVDGRPIITIGDGRNLKNGGLRDLQDTMGYIRYRFNQAQVGNPIIMIHLGAIENWHLSNADGYQCLVPSPALVVHNGDYNAFVNDHARFFQEIKNLGLPFSPCIASEFDERPRYKVFIDRITELRFLKNFSFTALDRGLTAAVAGSGANGVSKLLNVYAWNEWHEGGIIEPNVKHGTRFLEVIESNLKTKPLNLFVNSSGQKVATAESSVAGYTKIKSWKLFSEFRTGQAKKSAIYECRISGQTGPNRFLTGDRNCEGQTNVNGNLPIGFVLNTTSEIKNPVKLIYRCNTGSFHFVSDDVNCEKLPGQNIINEGPIGYTPL